MKKYLSEILENEEFTADIFLVSAIEKIAKTGKKYITGEVLDKTLKLKFNLWNIENRTLEKNCYYSFTGKLEKYNNSFQINLFKIRKKNEKNIDLLDFKKSTDLNIENLYNDLLNILSAIKDPFYKFLADEIFVKNEDFIKNFKNSPAAEKVHGAYIGGLLEHSVNIAKMAEILVNFYNEFYFFGKLSKDLTVIGSLLHDIGKMWEYDYHGALIKTTKKGELLGHIYMSSNLINDLANKYKAKFPDCDIDEKLIKLIHLVLSHHGKLEFGAPVVPKIPEAIIVYHLDNIDAKMINFLSNTKNAVEEFTDRNFVHENARLYNIFLDEKRRINYES